METASKKLSPQAKTLRKEIKAEIKWLKNNLRDIDSHLKLPDDSYKSRALDLDVQAVYNTYWRMQNLIAT